MGRIEPQEDAQRNAPEAGPAATSAARLAGGSLFLAATFALLQPTPARACGGFFCDGPGSGAGPTPVVQAAERVLFEQREDGRIRAYVQIQYAQQAGVPIGFSWVIPVTSVPELGVADPATFDQLDQATSPQFRFVNQPRPTGGGGGGGGGGCAAGDALAGVAADAGAPTTMDGVRVWDESRIGDYQTAIVEGETGDAIRDWLARNDYDIPDSASETLDHYVFTGHLFAAFRYDPIDRGTGSLPPVVLTYRGDKPCVPIRITAIASMPILDVMVLAFGPGRARPDGEYTETVPDYQAIRMDATAPTGTTYAEEVSRAIEASGRHAWVVEHASTTADLQGLSDPEAQALASRSPYVTRFYTRFTPEQMDVDPEFVFDEGPADVNRLHVIDLGVRRATLVPGDELRYAAPPVALAFASAALFFRRRRR